MLSAFTWETNSDKQWELPRKLSLESPSSGECLPEVLFKSQHQDLWQLRVFKML